MCSNSPSSSLTQKLFVIHHQNDLDSLWMHITTSNIHYTFTVLKDKEGTYHIAANPDRTMTPRLKRVEGAPSLAFQNEVIYRRQGDVFCQKISTKGVVFKAYKPEPSLEESLAAKTGTIAPIRDYFHPIGFSRITIGEWMLLETIVSPSDDAWQLRIANSVSLVRTLANAMTIILIQSHMLDKQMLDDFNDVSDEEKRFIKLWNAFVRSSPIHINNKDLRNQCMVFVGLHASVIGDYEEHLICHLITYVVWNSLNKKKRKQSCLRPSNHRQSLVTQTNSFCDFVFTFVRHAKKFSFSSSYLLLHDNTMQSVGRTPVVEGRHSGHYETLWGSYPCKLCNSEGHAARK